MNINEVLHCGFSIIGMMLIYVISTSSQAADVIIIPPNPTAYDTIFVGAYGVENNGCVPNNAQVSVSENVIYIDFPPIPAGVGCSMAFTEWAEMVPTNRQLPEGTYDVIVTRGDTQLARHSFMVQNSPKTSTLIKLQQVTCKNLTTSKKKVINNPPNSWSCEAAGLKVHPGDKIEQILVGIAKK